MLKEDVQFPKIWEEPHSSKQIDKITYKLGLFFWSGLSWTVNWKETWIDKQNSVSNSNLQNIFICFAKVLNVTYCKCIKTLIDQQNYPIKFLLRASNVRTTNKDRKSPHSPWQDECLLKSSILISTFGFIQSSKPTLVYIILVRRCSPCLYFQ